MSVLSNFKRRLNRKKIFSETIYVADRDTLVTINTTKEIMRALQDLDLEKFCKMIVDEILSDFELDRIASDAKKYFKLPAEEAVAIEFVKGRVVIYIQ